MLISASYNNLIKSYHLPRIEEIPDLELYMDQVIIYVKKYFSVFPYASESNFITPAMINNYVKSGLMPSPVGKKYTRRHIAYILAVFFLKQIYSLEEVRAFINLQLSHGSEKECYELFCDILETELKKCIAEEDNAVINIPSKNIGEKTIRHAALSIANKLYSQELIKQHFKK